MMSSNFNSRLSEERLDIAAVHSGFLGQYGYCGALTTFIGIVRPMHGRQAIQYLELDWYPGLSDRSIDAVARAAAERFPLEGLTIVHRCGKILAGEPIVFVGAAGLHRRETLEAVDYAMDRLKSDVALWKREVGPGLDHWVEPTLKDRADLRRWGAQ